MRSLFNEMPRRSAHSPSRLVAVFAILFVAYQLPEGLGMRLLHSVPLMAALSIGFLPLAWLCGRMLGFPRGLDAWYMGRTPGWVMLLVACFGVAVLAKVLALIGGAGIGVYHVALPADQGLNAVLLTALGMLPYTFFPSVAEDIVTRGFLLRALPMPGRHWAFIMASALLYVLNHIYRLSNGPLEWLMLFCFGLAYAAALRFSGSLWAAIGLHWGWNYAGQLSDRLAQVDAVVPGQGPLISSVAHLVLLAMVVLAARRVRGALVAGR
jgi:uncharacterized protein